MSGYSPAEGKTTYLAKMRPRGSLVALSQESMRSKADLQSVGIKEVKRQPIQAGCDGTIRKAA